MRTIKFRGKDVNTGEWLYWKFGDGNGDTFYNKVIPETVCQLAIQYKEYDIYEHDLVRLRGLLGEVVFDSKKGCFCVLYIITQKLSIFSLGEELILTDIELEGNIFDNK
jgi:hypothetical protein